MTTSSLSTDARARKNEGILRNAISSVGQNTVAQEISVSPTTVSRYVTEEDGLTRACKIAAAAGVKFVPNGYQCFPKKTVEALMHLARERMNGLQDVDQLMWDE